MVVRRFSHRFCDLEEFNQNKLLKMTKTLGKTFVVLAGFCHNDL